MARYTKKPVDPSNLGTDPNSYTYVDGYGFTPPPPVITERRMLQFYANGLGFAVLFYFLLSALSRFCCCGCSRWPGRSSASTAIRLSPPPRSS